MYKPSVEMEPIFFKHIVPLACTERLKLPPAHRWNKDRGVFPDNVILTDKKGNIWPVKLEMVENYVCFVDGWLDFVKENNVEVGDFVVFQNVDHNVYSVLLLDPNTTCEKEDLKSNIEDYEAFEEELTSESFKDVIVKDEEEDITEEEEKDDDDDDVEEEEEYDDFDLEEESIDLSGNSSRLNEREDEKRRTKSAHGSGDRKRATDIYGNAMFKSRGIPLPKNPYFVTYRRPNRNDELFVPLNVIKDYNLNLPIKTIMRDSRGAEWVTELNVWRDGRCWYNGGWGNFCIENYVEESETCVCEFVEEAGKCLTLFVYKLSDKSR